MRRDTISPNWCSGIRVRRGRDQPEVRQRATCHRRGRKSKGKGESCQRPRPSERASPGALSVEMMSSADYRSNITKQLLHGTRERRFFDQRCIDRSSTVSKRPERDIRADEHGTKSVSTAECSLRQGRRVVAAFVDRRTFHALASAQQSSRRTAIVSCRARALLDMSLLAFAVGARSMRRRKRGRRRAGPTFLDQNRSSKLLSCRLSCLEWLDSISEGKRAAVRL